MGNAYPKNYSRMRYAASMTELCNSRFVGDVNLILFRRGPLMGDFNALARRLKPETNAMGQIRRLLESYDLSERERLAATQIQEDWASFDNCVSHELRVVAPGAYPESTYDFHEDGSNRMLCCYNDPATLFLRNEDAAAVSSETAPISKYVPKDGAPVFHLGLGDVTLHLAGDFMNAGTGFIHRAQDIPAEAPPRILMIASYIEPSPYVSFGQISRFLSS